VLIGFSPRPTWLPVSFSAHGALEPDARLENTYAQVRVMIKKLHESTYTFGDPSTRRGYTTLLTPNRWGTSSNPYP